MTEMHTLSGFSKFSLLLLRPTRCFKSYNSYHDVILKYVLLIYYILYFIKFKI